MWLTLWRKPVFVYICPVLLLCTQRVVQNWSIFSSGFAPFLTCWEKQTLQVFLSFFLRESIFWLKSVVFSEFLPKCFKITEKHSLAVCGSFWGVKPFLLIIIPFYRFDQKSCLNKSKFPQDLPLFKLVKKKQTLWVFLCTFLRYILFWLKSVFFSELSRKCFKITEKHSLVVCGSFWGEIFFLYSSSFTSLNKKGCLQQILIFLRICFF